MTDVITVEQKNAVHLVVTANPGTRQEISEYFSFKPAGYQFSPAYKNRVWDGVIRLYQPLRPTLYVGLFPRLKKFCEDRGYELQAPDHLMIGETVPDDYGYEMAKEVSCKFKPRDYQNQYIVDAVRDSRSLSLSPTSSGKSLIIYLLQQHYWRAYEHRTLIIVPTISLVHQMAGDFADYGCTDEVYKIQGGVDKQTDAPIVISTWQSLIKLPKEWFSQFQVVLGDEAHLFQAKSLQKIMEGLDQCYYRHGFTGTLKSEESKTHRLVLEGCFGAVRKHVSTKDLIDAGTVADFNVKAIVLSHNPEARKGFKDAFKKIKEGSKRYPAEREFLVNNDKRNIFIRNLLWSLEGQNNLVLFDLVEKHGKIDNYISYMEQPKEKNVSAFATWLKTILSSSTTFLHRMGYFQQELISRSWIT